MTAFPLAAALFIPATNALDQLNVAPVTELVGVYVKGDPEQISAGANVLVRSGIGFTRTVTFWVLEHPFADRVNSYTTSIGALVLFINDSLIDPVLFAAELVIPFTIALDQLYVVPAVALVGV
jgi:hypothetical protein